jgi:hypothetical protein
MCFWSYENLQAADLDLQMYVGPIYFRSWVHFFPSLETSCKWRILHTPGSNPTTVDHNASAVNNLQRHE